MSARDEILATVRRSLGAATDDAARRAAVESRIGAGAPGLRPLRGQGDADARARTFVDEAQRVSVTIERVASLDLVPEAAARFLRARNLAAHIRMGEDARLAAMPWSATQLEMTRGPSAGDDLNAISFAEAGVAETGTLVFVSGAHNPTTLNFLPDNHIAVLRTADIEADYEAVWIRLRARFGKGVLPRTVNFVTGPSRSADIEQKLLLGAHGPRSLHIIMVDD
ncbi:MAG: LUD domain-containing protein [Beijerinckiaceae bacterium]|nr:LUD domain-containing protein [Beijerinckiaceae bacterium]